MISPLGDYAAFGLRHSFLASLVGGDKKMLGSEIHAELVAYLFASRWQLAIMSLAYVTLSLVALLQSGDSLLGFFALLATALTLAHFGLVQHYHRCATLGAREQEDKEEPVAHWERSYALASYLSAACLGIVEARIFLSPSDGAALLGIALLYAQGASFVARLCTRPRIAVVSLFLAMAPAVAGMIAQGGFTGLGLAAFTTAFFVGGVETALHIYRAIGASLLLRHGFAALARRDDLTGLPNRLMTRERLDEEIARVNRNGGLAAVHYLDLDRFKSANDRFGHPAGDALLKEVAQRLSQLVRGNGFVGRLGGDEFMIIQTGVVHKSEVEVLAMRIIRAIAQPFEIHGCEITIGTSIGIAMAPTDAADMGNLIKYADAALYAAKRRSRSSYAFYEDCLAEFPAAADEDDPARSFSAF